MYFVYLIESQSTGSFYIGHTSRLVDRIAEHNQGKSRSTKTGIPWELIGYIITQTRSEAVQLEQKLKGFNRRDRAYKYIETNGKNLRIQSVPTFHISGMSGVRPDTLYAGQRPPLINPVYNGVLCFYNDKLLSSTSLFMISAIIFPNNSHIADRMFFNSTINNHI